MRNAHIAVGKRKEKTIFFEKCRHPKSDATRWQNSSEKTLRWFGHVQRRDNDEATRKILQMTVDGKLRWRDMVKEDMARNQMPTEMAEDRKHWHVMIHAGTL